MEPMAAVGIASNVQQLVNDAGNITLGGRPAYTRGQSIKVSEPRSDIRSRSLIQPVSYVPIVSANAHDDGRGSIRAAVLPGAWDHRNRAYVFNHKNPVFSSAEIFGMSWTKFSGRFKTWERVRPTDHLPTWGRSEGCLCHVYPMKPCKMPSDRLLLPPLPSPIFEELAAGAMFPEFLDALEGFAGGNTSWNVGAARSYNGTPESCYVLNFILPIEPSYDTAKGAYVPVSALIYSRLYSDVPSILVISESDALDRIVSDAIPQVYSIFGLENPIAIHIYLADISTKGWTGTLLRLERQVRSWTSYRYDGSPSFLDDLTELRPEMEIVKELEMVSRLLGINVEAMAIIEETLGSNHDMQHSAPKSRYTEDDITTRYPEAMYTFNPQQISELHRLFMLMHTRARNLMKEMMRMKTEDTKEQSVVLLEQQTKIAYLSRAMNRVMGLTVMLFLPGILISTLFSSNFFQFSDSGILVTNSFWVFWAVLIPVSVVICGVVFVSTTSLQYTLRNLVAWFWLRFRQRWSLQKDRGPARTTWKSDQIESVRDVRIPQVRIPQVPV